MAQFQGAAGKWGLVMARAPGADLLETGSTATLSLQKQSSLNIVSDTTLIAAIANSGHENSSKHFAYANITTSRFKPQERASNWLNSSHTMSFWLFQRTGRGGICSPLLTPWFLQQERGTWKPTSNGGGIILQKKS